MTVEIKITKEVLMDLVERHCISELNKACQTKELRIQNSNGYSMSDYKDMTLVTSVELGENLKDRPPR